MRKLLIVLAAIAPVVPAAAAVTVPPTIVRATVDKLDGDRLEVTDRTGHRQVLLLAPDARVATISTIDIAAITPGSFIGTAAAPGPNGTLRALEVHVFPEAMRGTGEGHRPWDLGAGTTMTNGTVGTVSGSSGRTIKVSYKGGEQSVVVPADVPIVTFAPGERSQLVAGAHVMSFAMPHPPGQRRQGRHHPADVASSPAA